MATCCCFPEAGFALLIFISVDSPKHLYLKVVFRILYYFHFSWSYCVSPGLIFFLLVSVSVGLAPVLGIRLVGPIWSRCFFLFNFSSSPTLPYLVFQLPSLGLGSQSTHVLGEYWGQWGPFH